MSAVWIIIFVVIFILIIILVAWLVFYRKKVKSLTALLTPIIVSESSISSVSTFRIKNVLSGLYVTVDLTSRYITVCTTGSCLNNADGSLLWCFYPDPTDKFLTLKHVKSGLYASARSVTNDANAFISDGTAHGINIVSIAKVPVTGSPPQVYLKVSGSILGLTYDPILAPGQILIQNFDENPHAAFLLE
jgi:hypothetical protein